MELDSRIFKYMQKKAEYAKVYASAFSVQCFALAVFFCVYGLYETGLFYSQSKEMGKTIIIALSIIISVGLCVYNVLVGMKYKELVKYFPDSIAINQSKDIVEEAYQIARPVLVLKITISIAIMLFSGFAYILLLIFMDKSFMAGVYGRILVYVLLGMAIMIGIPCVDRILNYRAMLKIRHVAYEDLINVYPYLIAAGIGIPFSICAWYILKCYMGKADVAFIVFPMTALFFSAFAFLSHYITKSKPANDSII